MADCLSNLLATVAKAYGRIRNYQLAVSAVLFLNLPLSYVALKAGASPVSVYAVYVAVSLLLLVLRLWLLHKWWGMMPAYMCAPCYGAYCLSHS